MKGLIEGLLEYSQSNHVLKTNKINLNLISFIGELESLFAFKNNCRIELKSEIDSIFIHKTALEQIFINLIANAIKYNDKPEVKILIEVGQDEKSYIFSVKDNGPGILPENQERIFQIFEVIADKDKFGERGNGIGLATVKKIVEAHNGIISVESEIGKGAKFIFTLDKN